MQKVISIDGKQLDKIAEALKDFPQEIKPAISSAINKTMRSTVTQIKKEVNSEYNIKQRDVGKAIKVTNSKVKTLTAIANAEGGQTAMYKFDHKPKKRPKSLGWGKNAYSTPLTVQAKKGGEEKKVAHGKNLGFLAPVIPKGGNMIDMIFVREGKKRFPIKKLFLLSVPQMISDKNDSKGSITRIKAKANEMLEKKVTQEINYRVLKIAKKAQGGK